MPSNDTENREDRKLDESGSSENANANVVDPSNTQTSGRQFGNQYQHYPPEEQIAPGQSRVVVTASNRRGETNNHHENMHKNVPPPRLHPASVRRSEDYKVDYPGANLRLLEPQPSHLTGQSDSPARRGEPHSIIFGSSSKSRGAYYIQRQDTEDHEEYDDSQIVHRPPINYYNPSIARPSENFRPSKLMNPAHMPNRKHKLPANFHRPPIHQNEEEQRHHHRYQNNQESRKVNTREDGSYNKVPSTYQTTAMTTTVHQVNNYRLRNDADPSILSQLGSISKLGVRRQNIDHRINLNRSSPQDMRIPSDRNEEDRKDNVDSKNRDTFRSQTPEGKKYDTSNRIDNKQYGGFISRGEVYTTAPLIPRPRRPSHRITTLRPANDRAVVPYEDTRGAYVPRYVKNNIQEMEFDPKTIDTPNPVQNPSPGTSGVGYIHNLPSNYWFLMPVQAWFTLSIVLAAVVVILTIVCFILYYSLKKQRKKVRKLLSPWGTCIDPLHHELCSCRNVTTLMRGHNNPMTRASMMSRMSHRSVMPGSGQGVGGVHRPGVINYDNASQQMTTGFRSLPTPSIKEREQMEEEAQDSMNTINTEVKISKIDDTPPPLAPKMSSLHNRGENLSGNKHALCTTTKYQDGFTLKRTSARSSHSTSQSKYEKPPSLKLGLKPSNNSDVQLTTIYPPPSRFEL